MPLKKYAPPRLASDSVQPKQRKPRAPMARPPGLTNNQLAATTDRQNRLNMKRVRDAAARQEEASRVGMANLPPNQQADQYPQGAWGSQQSVALPDNFSPSLLGTRPRPSTSTATH
ncbi:hypothetical protein D1007_39584 [Hordeum vulgare]|nr:hypothetical protein D1007_39584 [Hordeum vulgare]